MAKRHAIRGVFACVSPGGIRQRTRSTSRFRGGESQRIGGVHGQGRVAPTARKYLAGTAHDTVVPGCSHATARLAARWRTCPPFLRCAATGQKRRKWFSGFAIFPKLVCIVCIVCIVFPKVLLEERIEKVSESAAHCAHCAHLGFLLVGWGLRLLCREPLPCLGIGLGVRQEGGVLLDLSARQLGQERVVHEMTIQDGRRTGRGLAGRPALVASLSNATAALVRAA